MELPTKKDGKFDWARYRREVLRLLKYQKDHNQLTSQEYKEIMESQKELRQLINKLVGG